MQYSGVLSTFVGLIRECIPGASFDSDSDSGLNQMLERDGTIHVGGGYCLNIKTCTSNSKLDH